MAPTIKDLDPVQIRFIELLRIDCKTYKEISQTLGLDLETIRRLDKELEPIWRPLTKVREKWKAKAIGGDFWEFHNWFTTTPQKCHYCGVTQTQLDQLHEHGLENKRPTRGKSLEIERKAPNEQYSNTANLTLACYWCNNAKSDTFTEEEFMPIGQAIGKVWEQRLKNDYGQ